MDIDCYKLQAVERADIRNMAEAITSDLPDTSCLAHLRPPSWKADIQRWFAEDTPSFDWAGYVVGEEEQEAILWGKSGVRLCQLHRDRLDTMMAHQAPLLVSCWSTVEVILTTRASWPGCRSLTKSWRMPDARELASLDPLWYRSGLG